MKITIVQGAFLPVPPALGGAVEKMWFALGKEFALQGHQVIHISRQYSTFPLEEMIDGVQHIRVKGYDTPANGLYLKWLDLLYSLKVKTKIPADSEVIITNTFWIPIIIKFDLKRKCFIDVARLPKGQMKFYKNAGRLRANSNIVVEAIKKEVTESNWKRVIMIPNPLPFDVSNEIDIQGKEKLMLYTGRIHSEKGLELLINAFKQVNSGWKLQIVGPYDTAAGGGGEAYNNLLKKQVSDFPIEFIGPVYETDILNSYYKKAAIFIYPSVAEQGETFGLAPLEAMAWGCVPIVSDLDCFKDFISHEVNGLIFDHRAKHAVQLLSNAISKLIEDQRYTENLAEKAIQVRQSHSTPVIGSEFLTAFKKMTSTLKQGVAFEECS